MKNSSLSAALLAALVFPGRLAPPDTISSTDSFLPAVHINGASGVFRTDVTIFNPDPSSAAVVDLYYTEADHDGTGRGEVDVGDPYLLTGQLALP